MFGLSSLTLTGVPTMKTWAVIFGVLFVLTLTLAAALQARGDERPDIVCENGVCRFAPLARIAEWPRPTLAVPPEGVEVIVHQSQPASVVTHSVLVHREPIRPVRSVVSKCQVSKPVRGVFGRVFRRR